MKTQISLCICADWSESSLSAWRRFASLSTYRVSCEDSDQTAEPDSFIMKTCLYNVDPLKPRFNTVKLGFAGVYIIFLISAEKHTLWVLVRTARRGGCNEYPQSMFWAEIWKLSEFLSENFHFSLAVEFSVYLNRRVFVMFLLNLYVYLVQKVRPEQSNVCYDGMWPFNDVTQRTCSGTEPGRHFKTDWRSIEWKGTFSCQFLGVFHTF